jgi:hypothetical protein
VAGILYDFYAGFGAIRAMTFYGSVLAILGIVPFIGFVKQRAYSPRWLWKSVFVINALYSMVLLAGVLFVLFKTLSLEVVLGLAILVAYLGPYLFALYEYSFRCPEIWNKPSTQIS